MPKCGDAALLVPLVARLRSANCTRDGQEIRMAFHQGVSFEEVARGRQLSSSRVLTRRSRWDCDACDCAPLQCLRSRRRRPVLPRIGRMTCPRSSARNVPSAQGTLRAAPDIPWSSIVLASVFTRPEAIALAGLVTTRKSFNYWICRSNALVSALQLLNGRPLSYLPTVLFAGRRTVRTPILRIAHSQHELSVFRYASGPAHGALHNPRSFAIFSIARTLWLCARCA